MVEVRGRLKQSLQPPSLPLGSVGRFFAAIHKGLDPVLYLLLNPEGLGVSVTVAKLHTLGKETCTVEPLNGCDLNGTRSLKTDLLPQTHTETLSTHSLAAQNHILYDFLI